MKFTNEQLNIAKQISDGQPTSKRVQALRTNVLRMRLQGYSYKEIAEWLGISHSYVSLILVESRKQSKLTN